MSLFEEIKNYTPANEQEERDKVVMLDFIEKNADYLSRENLVGHFTTSIWTVNKERTKTLMVYHNLYDSWAWLGGHADGEKDLLSVALREVQEESGLAHLRPLSDDIFSIEILPVSGHEKKGQYIPSHVHLNITFLLEGDPSTPLCSKPDENSAVAWFSLDDAVAASSETWFQQRIYSKLNEKLRQFP